MQAQMKRTMKADLKVLVFQGVDWVQNGQSVGCTLDIRC